MENPVEFAIRSFESNRVQAEQKLVLLKRRLEGHEHGRFCFRWRWCRRNEQEAVGVERRIRDYREAESGLRSGDFSKAIEVLNALAPKLEESPLETAHRVASTPPTISSILSSPTAVRPGILRLRDELVALQEGEQAKV